MKLLKDKGMRYPTATSNKKYRYGLYECPMCLKYFEAQTADVKGGNTTKCKSCGHATHGMADTKLYKVWTAMKQRCNNPSDKGYKDYGGRGITVCDEWQEFISFKDWALANGYTDALTIDRKNNDGHYNPDNCRYSTRETQSRNTRLLRTSNTSGYRGVSFYKQRKKWIAKVTVSFKSIHIGTFSTAKEAAQARDAYVIKHNLEHTLNFPDNTMLSEMSAQTVKTA